jgi:flagellar biosynthesis protein FlhB
MHATIDSLVKRRRLAREQSMTTQEVRDEYRELEGDPLVRRRRQALQEEMVMAELVKRVKAARVVVVDRG